MTHKCRSCPVIGILKEFSKEYEDFLVFIGVQNLNLLTDHARGYCRGQTTLATDVVEDMSGVIECVKTEANLLVKDRKA